eukprot:TRINITY_DN25999_c2_g2_i1.p2 TRINITY_DN25999_c2_g2~~TRINITY_DN25999_c2_g2_i1.p2  ORF type:complete len:104 (-),score=12.77 TRINITY_DN25999_c2_g2_i1:157-468(-)
MNAVSEKVTRVSPMLADDVAEVQQAECKLENLSNTKSFGSVVLPDVAVTESQQYGLYRTNQFQESSPMFRHARNTCDVTTYADAYVTMAGSSPYKRKDIGATI